MCTLNESGDACRRYTAFHEAGHILIATLKNVVVTESSIDVDKITDHAGWTDYDDTIFAVSIDDYILIKLGGFAGERACFGTLISATCEEENDRILEGCKADFDEIGRHLNDATNLTELMTIATSIVSNHKDKFDSLVKLLLEKGTVSQGDIQQALIAL